MKLLIDMNLSPRWAERLSDAEVEAVHWSTVGQSRATDQEIMAYAVEHAYIVLTHDLDFGAILAATRELHPSVAQTRAGDVSPETIGAAVVAALRQMETELAKGALLTIDPERTRLRLLPLR